MFRKILIANRGEIACRIARTAHRLGIATVMVYSDADANALHVRNAREALRLGEGPAAGSYLDIDKIIEAARISGAEAIHPGYGFLSENAALAEACAAAGLVFIGPSPEAIKVMGSKSAAKALMASHGVPLVPGYYGDEQDATLLGAEAERIGFPVLVKASAGGGGRGMRVVREAGEFQAALASAQREAQSAFGDSHMLLEKYVERPRHIEVQVFGDQYGNVVHLFERDCSFQRRHQKVVEEAPALLLSDAQRKTLFAAAVAAGRAVRYVGAGTVEFVVAPDGAIYFIEMNTRLQVEHPVTEAITGQDLVEWQLRVASGEALPLAQADITQQGHAVEVRVYAEDPALDFRPSIGRISHVKFPAASADVRIDTGVESGDSVSPWYDAMIAKIITRGDDRTEALRRMSQALGETELAGLNGNLDYLRRICDHPGYIAGGFTTHFAEEERARLLPSSDLPSHDVLLLAAASVLTARKSPADGSPWAAGDNFRLNHALVENLDFQRGEEPIVLRAQRDAHGYTVHLPDGAALRCKLGVNADGGLLVDTGERRFQGTVSVHGDAHEVFYQGHRVVLHLRDPLHEAGEEETATGSLLAPMPGAITALMVAVGDVVSRGQALLVLEAMKIEHTIAAPFAGKVTDIFYSKGQQVAQEGAELVRLEPLEGGDAT